MNSRRVNILFVVTSLAAGGLETYLVNVIQYIDRSRFAIYVVYTGQKSDWYLETLEAMGVRVLGCYNSYLQIPFMFRLRNIMRQHKIEIVCDFRNDFSGPALWAASSLNIPVRAAMYRSTRHSFESTALKQGYLKLMHFLTVRYATRIMANSRAILDKFYPGWTNSDKFQVVYNGVDLDKFCSTHSDDALRDELGIPAGAVVVGHVGSFRSAKNHTTLLNVFKNVKHIFDDSYLLLVGDGPLRPQIEQQAQALGIQSSVILAGNRTDIPALLNLMDVFLFPSVYEGMPNALVEAMACGRPFAASNIPEIAEIIPADLKGQLCDPTDVEAHTEKALTLLKNRLQADQIADKARKHVEQNFSIQASTERLLSILTE